MTTIPVLEEWNLMCIAAMEGLIANVTPNLRMVWLDRAGTNWVCHFVLEIETEADIDAIDDAATAIEILAENRNFQSEVLVSSEILPQISNPARVIFARREEVE